MSEFTAWFSAGRVPDQRLSRTEKGIPSYTLEKSMICDAALCVLEISLSAVSGLQKWMHYRVRGKLWADMCKLGKNSRDSSFSVFVPAMQSGRCPALCEGFPSCTLGGIAGNRCGAQCDVS